MDGGPPRSRDCTPSAVKDDWAADGRPAEPLVIGRLSRIRVRTYHGACLAGGNVMRDTIRGMQGWCALALLVLAAWAVPGAGQARADWGAIAVSEAVRDPGWGYAYRHRSPDGARRRALAECRKRAGDSACNVEITFGNSCGAVGYAVVTGKRDDGKPLRVMQLQRSAASTPADTLAAFGQACGRFRDKYSSIGVFECAPLAVVCARRGLVKR